MKPPVSIHTTTRPATDTDIEQHSSIRLAALWTNPNSFVSTYEHESNFDRAKWKERLEQEGVWTFYAKFNEVNENLGHAHNIPPKPWLATMSLLSPSFLSWFLTSDCPSPITTNTVSSPTPAWPLSLLGLGTDLWLINGLWVRPEWRRKGVAKTIVQRAVHFVVNSSHLVDTTTPEASSNSKTTIVLLEVYASNIAAVELYQSVGFKILSNPDKPSSPKRVPSHIIKNRSRESKMEEPKTHWMGYTIPPLFRHRSKI